MLLHNDYIYTLLGHFLSKPKRGVGKELQAVVQAKSDNDTKMACCPLTSTTRAERATRGEQKLNWDGVVWVEGSMG